MIHETTVIAAQRELAQRRGSLKRFVRMIWPIIEPGSEYLHNWHIDAICEHLEAMYFGEMPRLVINIPPGCMKSTICGVALPIWVWIQDPTFKWIFGSYDAGLTLRDAEKALLVLQSEWFVKRWGDRVQMQRRVAGVGDYTNTARGYRFSTSVGGPVTGRHCDWQVADDPHKSADFGAVDTVKRWWSGPMATRMRDPKTGRRLVVMQRLHTADLAGLCAEEGYVHLKIPMEYEPARTVVTPLYADPRTEPGELLWPDRFPADVTTMLKKELGPRNASAQLQQEPNPEGGLVFNESWIKLYDEYPRDIDEQIISIDCTFDATAGSDFVVLQVWGRAGANMYLLDQMRDRLDFPSTLKMFETACAKHPQAFVKLVEKAANGAALISSLKDRIQGITPVTPRGSKIARANAVTGAMAAGNVHLPRFASYTGELVEELLSFPSGAHDDQVDAMTQALNHWISKEKGFAQVVQALRDQGGTEDDITRLFDFQNF